MNGSWKSEDFETPTGNRHHFTLRLETGPEGGLNGSFRVVSDRKDGRKIDTLVPLTVQTQGSVAVMMASGVNAPEGLLAMLLKHQLSGEPSASPETLSGQILWHSLTDGEIRSQVVRFHPTPEESQT